MKILAFDTSSTALSVALLEDSSLLAETVINIKQNHSVNLMPTIDFLLTAAGLTPGDLDRIVVAEGPGSYTGLRMAVATAKTLAYSLKIDLVGVSSLASLALASQQEGLVIPLIDARRRNVYAGFYLKGKALEPDRHASLLSIMEQLEDQEELSFVGEVAAFEEEIKEHFPKAKVLTSLPSAYQIGKLGQKLPPCEVHSFVPNYLKRVEAEENWLKSQNQPVENGENYIKKV